jgi:hypothetical protein
MIESARGGGQARIASTRRPCALQSSARRKPSGLPNGRRFMTHNEGFDFAATIPEFAGIEAHLAPIIRRQIKSAERLIELTRHGRVKLRRYEQTVEIDG